MGILEKWKLRQDYFQIILLRHLFCQKKVKGSCFLVIQGFHLIKCGDHLTFFPPITTLNFFLTYFLANVNFYKNLCNFVKMNRLAKLRRHASNSFGPIHFVLEHFRLHTLGFEHVGSHPAMSAIWQLLLICNAYIDDDIIYIMERRRKEFNCFYAIMRVLHRKAVLLVLEPDTRVT